MEPYRVFYHADLSGSLAEDQPLELTRGLSMFGLTYEQVIGHDYRLFSDHYHRELALERVRTHNPNIAGRVPSRLTAFFACLTAEDAKLFAHRSGAQQKTDQIKIFEIIARPRSFNFRDMSWLDFHDTENAMSNYVSYWSEMLTQAVHDNPFIEVCVQLPARTGRVVETFSLSSEFSWRAPIKNVP